MQTCFRHTVVIGTENDEMPEIMSTCYECGESAIVPANEGAVFIWERHHVCMPSYVKVQSVTM